MPQVLMKKNMGSLRNHAKATGTLLNKNINEQNNGCARAL